MDSRRGSNFNSKPGESINDRSGNDRSGNDRSGSGRSSKSGQTSQNFQNGDENEVEIRDRFQINDTIDGTYKIVSRLGQGGMGQVFGVEHMMLRQTYALKILTADSPNNIGWRRFQTEARTIAKLDHPNIIKVHNLGIHDKRVPYYVMELLDGETLSALVRRQGPLTTKDVIDLFIPICDGLAYAHASGVVHRDIKPSNIMLVAKNRKIVPKVVDFGLVKLVGGALSPTQQLTATGEVFGSPLYMSPEQSVGRHINERSDIYSLGCTMFEALTGAPPFVGENAVQTILKHQSEEPPTLKQASMGLNFSPEWEAVIVRVLAKEASDRYQTMDELAHDLEAIKEGKKLSIKYTTTGGGDLFSEEEEKKQAVARGNQMVLASAGLVLLLVCMGAGGYHYYFKQQRPAKPAHVDSLSLGGVQKEDAVRIAPAEHKELENISIPFVQNGGQPINGFKIFKFPSDISLGTLILHDKDISKKPLVYDARGEQKIPANGLLAFEASSECGIHPKIFRKFLRDDLVSVTLPGGINDTDTDDELYFLNHLTNLEYLNLDGTDVTPKGLKIVGEMPKLVQLSMIKTNKLTGRDLAKLKFLDRLALLNFGRGKDVSPLLLALKGSKAIAALYLDQTALTAADIKLVATMSKLEDLSLNGCHLTTKDLTPLNTLPVLHRLWVRGNTLSPDFIDIFNHSGPLRWLELSKPQWSEADLARLDAVLHNRYKFRDLDKIEI